MNLKLILQRIGIIFFAVTVTFMVYWKIPVKGLRPFPGDLLAGRFFPFNTMDWEGYPLGVPYKEFINADVIRQLYPWRDLAIHQLKQGKMPWWNPYAFAGSPLLANIQSAPFYPLNGLYWLTSHQNAWILGVMLQPILAILGMWLFTRELGLSRLPAGLASVSFAFGGYMVIWFELNTVGHAALWLPWILWGIERLRRTGRHRNLVLIIFGQTSSLLAGHLQTATYVLIVSLAYFLFRFVQSQKRNKTLLVSLVLANVLSLILASGQLLPALRFMPLTPRGTQADEQIFTHFILPVKQMATFLAHDYFGNPAVGNFWGEDYGEFMGFFGMVALYFALLAIRRRGDSEVVFFSLAAAIALLFALPTPLVHVLRLTHVPILSTSAPSRTLFIVQFSGAVLAGFGAQYWLKGKVKLKAVSLMLFFVYILLWAIALKGIRNNVDVGQAENWRVALRNLVIPTGAFVSTAALLSFVSKWKFSKNVQTYLRKVSLAAVILIALFEYAYFANKFQTFSEARFFFPSTPIYTFLSEKTQESPDRFFGDYTASVTSNTWIPYRAYGVEGYDSLYIKRFGQLLAASEDGIIPDSVPRSDANLVKNKDELMRQRLQDIMGIRYILDKNDTPQSEWEPDPHRFPPERYQLIWQEGKFKVYENTQALPRAFLVGEVIVESNPQTIMDILFNPDFDISKMIIVEEEIPQKLLATEGSVNFIRYEPNTVELEVITPTPQLLFLSDVYYPDWKASVDGKETKIYRANFAFRAILVPEGGRNVRFFHKASFL